MKNESINFGEDSEEELQQVNSNLIHIKQVRPINSLDDLPEHFKPELRQLNVEDLFEAKLSDVVKIIQGLAPNRIVLTHENANYKQYLICDCEIRLKEYILMRGNKLICTGNYELMQKAFLDRIQKEYPGKFDQHEFDEIDETWIKNFSQMYFNNPTIYRIINLNL